MSNEISFSSDEMQVFNIGEGVIAVFCEYHSNAAKKAQILRVAPKLLELVSSFVSAEREKMQAAGKKVRIRHEAEDLLSELGCAIACKEDLEHEQVHFW